MMRTLFELVFRYGNWIAVILIAVLLYQALGQRGLAPKVERISEEKFASTLENDSVPVIVKFGATWCPPCRTTDIALGKAKVMIIDVEANPELASRYSVGSIPHSFLFFRGKMIDSHVGGMDADEINTWLDKKLITFPAGVPST
jgi:thioredoxin 1